MFRYKFMQVVGCTYHCTCVSIVCVHFCYLSYLYVSAQRLLWLLTYSQRRLCIALLRKVACARMTMQERINEVRDRVNAILETHRNDTFAPILALWDKVLDLLRPRNLIKKMKLSSRYVVVHPQNRYGDGVVPSQVHIYIYILPDNFSFSKWIIGNGIRKAVGVWGATSWRQTYRNRPIQRLKIRTARYRP